MEKTPCEMFKNGQVDYMRDFCVEWGEPTVVKKPKGISSDLKVTGQWAVVLMELECRKCIWFNQNAMHIVCILQ